MAAYFILENLRKRFSLEISEKIVGVTPELNRN